MSTYYFPFGSLEAISLQLVSRSISTTTASAAEFAAIPVTTVLYAASSGSIPVSGINGTSKSVDSCSLSAPAGLTGPAGPNGSKGSSITTCPAGTKECTALNVSLSTHINYPSGDALDGYQYSVVCIEIPPECIEAEVECPGSLPIAYPSIP